MAIRATKFIWQNGKLEPWDQARVHVMSHALHYGSSIFEGIRAYDTPTGTHFFRLADHIDRLLHSLRIHRYPLPYTKEELITACHLVVGANGLHSAYVRPLIFRGYGSLSLDPTDSTTETIVGAIEWGPYLGHEGLEKGVDVCVSSWQRVAPNTIPPMAKAGGNYLSGSLIHMEAKRLGFDEGLALTTDGTVGEGSGENLFVVKDGELLTPPSAGSILPGFTRDAVRHLAARAELPYKEVPIPRELLYTADEIFMTGTAAEITPVRSVDHLSVADGERGPITKLVQESFFGLFDGTTPDEWGWLEPLREGSNEITNAV